MAPDASSAVEPRATTARLLRFTVAERVLHWVVVVAFVAMVVTGAALYFPAIANYLDRPTAKAFHLYAAYVMGIGMLFVPLVAWLAGDRSIFRSVREVQYLDKDDVAWLKAGPIKQLGRVAPAPQGRFNAGQKLNTAMLSGGMVVIYVTGVLLWYGEKDNDWRFMGTVPVHDLFSMFLILLVVGHVYLAVIHPMTRAAFRGMVTGEVDRSFAEHHHAKWVAEVDAAAAGEQRADDGGAG